MLIPVEGPHLLNTGRRQLTPEERSRLQARLAADSDAGKTEKFHWDGVWQAFTDPLVWGYSFLFHGAAFALYTLSLFMPTIIANLGFATWKAQLYVSAACSLFLSFMPANARPLTSYDRMTVPPNTLAAIGIGFGAWIAARTGRRAPLIIAAMSIAIIGAHQERVKVTYLQSDGEI